VTVTLRTEGTGDEQRIGEVVAAAFNSQEHADLVVALRDSPNFIPELSLVAEVDDQIVGHVMISYVALDDDGTGRQIASLSPLAVAPEHQNNGIGSALVRDVTARADARGEPLVVLEGSPLYYSRFGFEPSAPLGIHITLPSWAPPEAAQVLRLTTYDPAIRGRVVYPPAFDLVSEE
jgi:putative acetyltransferase